MKQPVSTRRSRAVRELIAEAVPYLPEGSALQKRFIELSNGNIGRRRKYDWDAIYDAALRSGSLDEVAKMFGAPRSTVRTIVYSVAKQRTAKERNCAK